MSSNEVPNVTAASADSGVQSTVMDAANLEQERADKILIAKDLYSHGSRNFLVKNYSQAADELSKVCALYEGIYGELSDELGMPYLLYAKSLIALAVDENKVLDVPDEADDDDDDDDDEEEEADEETEAGAKVNATNGEAKALTTSTNGTAKSEAVNNKKPSGEADSTGEPEAAEAELGKNNLKSEKSSAEEPPEVSSSNDSKATTDKVGEDGGGPESSTARVMFTKEDGEKPSTSNGTVSCTENGDYEAQADDENDEASNLQLAWEILELASKIFSRQGLGGLPNLAETRTELANIEFENNILDAAREDYQQALRIYADLPPMYHRAKAEIHYKIGLIYLMQQMNKEGAASLKEACELIDAEINELKNKGNELTEKDKNNIQDLEETKQEIRAKIDEIEETQAQNIAEVRAALDSYIKPIMTQTSEDVDNGPSSSSTAASAPATSSSAEPAIAATTSSSSSAISSSKPTDISHLIKRKKPEDPNSEAEAASPAKRAAL